MLEFKKINNLVGWIVFVIATGVYLATVQRTASYWDCGEFIACSYKLQVPHPPGAPFFLLIGRMFSFLALGDVTQVAFWINVLSVLSSSFSILFLFWSITMLGLKLLPVKNEKELTPFQLYSLIGAGLIGSLAYTFSDSFWFSAVEAEVYAMSSFFTAAVFWAILRWERIDDPRMSNRWLILIAYTMGLSIGVHLLNLVAIPAFALVYYYKRFTNYNLAGVIASLVAGGFIIILIMNGVIPGLPTLAGDLEIMFVNSFGMPFGSGIIFFIVVLIGGVVFGVYYSHQKEKVVFNTAMLCLSFILLGYSSYGIALIRANYNPPINENDPSDIVRFVSYLKREQYGDRPLFYGRRFTSNLVDQKQGAAVYRKVPEKGKYEIYDYKLKNIYDKKMFFPRMYSKQSNHPQLYRERTGLGPKEDPSMGDNLKFMFTYQLGHIYWRYFGWNFIGRDSDIQDAGVALFTPRSSLPDRIGKNKGHNKFYGIPLILGLLGLVFMLMRNQRVGLVTGMLFFLTGLALVLYLNSPPVEPRERDYIYVGSFYVFAMWIGFGVMFMADVFRGFLKKGIAAPVLATVISLSAPLIMAQQGWDDHDRSRQYQSIESAKNLLNSCAPNAILFTEGDNDTFPLWYIQEVEGFRTDVRVCNLSLLGTDWYARQMTRKTYQSEALPITLKKENYIAGTNDYITYWDAAQGSRFPPQVAQGMLKQGLNLNSFINLLNNRDARLYRAYSKDDGIYTFPSKLLAINLDKNAIIKQGFVPKKLQDQIGNVMVWNIAKNSMYKHHLLMLDIISTNAKNGWKRPIYFTSNISSNNSLNLKPYMQLEGLAYRLLPVKNPQAVDGYVNTDIMYKNMMPVDKGGISDGKTKGFFYRGLNDPKAYHDENARRFPSSTRTSFTRLVEQLVREGKKKKAQEVALYCLNTITDEAIPYNAFFTPFVDALFNAGLDKKAIEVGELMGKRAEEELNYLYENNLGDLDQQTLQLALYKLQRLAQTMARQKDNKKAEELSKKYIGLLTTNQARFNINY
ncbi:MAG TPA: DUF2723 domain-containing protein [Microscillaceae bacterium]|nr:DUF2723 domain-containing protein [Microscillaceae bacterium]